MLLSVGWATTSKGWNSYSNPTPLSTIQPFRNRPLGPAARSTRSEATLIDRWPTRPDDDWQDVTLARGGDERAFERLYRLHVPRIRGLARRLAGEDAADELTQDVFVQAWQKLGTFRGEARFSTWLHRLAVNLIIENRRSLARRSWLQTDDQVAMEQAKSRPADAVFSMDFRAAIDQLPEGARHVFVLHDVEGYKHHEIGRLLGIAAGTSKGQLSRARMILRRWLGGGGAAVRRNGAMP